MDAPLGDGVSVIVPTYRGVRHIERSLRSLAAQKLVPERFEVIVVPNGPDDGTLAVIERVRRSEPHLPLRVVQVEPAGFARARNAGLAAARREYVTFVDDDDRVSRRYLASLLAIAGPDRVGLGQLADVDANGRGRPNFDTYVNVGTLAKAGQTVHPQECPTALSFDVAKIVPTWMAREVGMDESLRSGTDVVYWNTVVNRYRLKVRVARPEAHAVYYRSVRSGSHSRPSDMTYDFGITQRLEVIDRLAPVFDDPTQHLSAMTERTIRSQVGHMRSYLEAHPEDNERALDDIRARGYREFPYDKLVERRGRDLVVAYAFVPSNDTSAIVTARRILARGLVVDVVSCEPIPSRIEEGGTSALITQGYVDRELVVKGPGTWGNWKGITRFCLRGIEAIEDTEERKGEYRSIYSRAMWPASHILAALYKVRHPHVPWIAEFSDPVLHDIEGNDRESPIVDNELLDELRAGLRAAGQPVPDSDNLFAWVEHLAFALADHVVFTNEQQREYMRGYADPAMLSAFGDERSDVQPHPTLPSRFYDLVETGYAIDDDVVNIAYFGVFYVTRGLTEVVEALQALDPAVRRRVRLHLFTRKTDELLGDLADARIEDVVVVNSYAPYLEFLNLTTKFDALIVNDTRTTDSHPLNPYMPSKWSDYDGSGSSIWAIVEPGSVMSRRESAYVSPLGDAVAARAIIEQLVAAKFGV